jgi:hypothetical protein
VGGGGGAGGNGLLIIFLASSKQNMAHLSYYNNKTALSGMARLRKKRNTLTCLYHLADLTGSN